MSTLKERNLDLIQHIKTQFSYLITDLGFTLSEESEFQQNAEKVNYYFIKYTNDKYARQLEIVLHANSDYNLISLKKINAHSVPDYYDLENTIDIKDLDLFTNPAGYNYKDHIAYAEEDKRTYFSKVATKLQTDWRPYLIGENWFDRTTIDELYMAKGFKGKSGFQKDKLLNRIVEQIAFLAAYNYTILENSNDSYPFQYIATKMLTLYNSSKDIFIKIDISYKNQMLSLNQRQSASQSYRLLNFTPIQSADNNPGIEKIVEQWIREEMERGTI